MFVVLCAAQVRADSTPTSDPKVKTGGGSGSVPITSTIFSITIDPSGSSGPDIAPCTLTEGGISTLAPDCVFQNDIMVEVAPVCPPDCYDDPEVGVTISQLSFFISNTVFSGTLTCDLLTAYGPSPWFNACSVDPAGQTIVTFSGGSGILPGGDFSLEFDDFHTGGVTVGGIATIPEPATLTLFLGGIGALVARRRSRAR
jgi:hypothetical protein